ncbi:hypothetical protein SO3561_07355 [Streptomyces olivochromogenes]|uniref:Uncharacterized protein n=2 Tax=Streptomyces olivochromogenes TaxID=1963 RepID=A0A250VNJ4_STROL|nr:hypothetical protein SO3561_07355 [Streptomyces olivochromogenes]
MKILGIACAARLFAHGVVAGQGSEGVAVNRVRYRWRDEYEGDPEYQRILAAVERPWWKRPVTIIGGVVAVTVASFLLGGALMGSGGSSGTSSPDPWVQGQGDGQSQNNQQQNNQPVGMSAAQKFQLLNQFCNQQAGGPTNVDEAALLECNNSYYVTDQGQVLPK